MDDEPDFQFLYQTLKDATEAHKDAQQAESAARNRCTTALNKMNDAQKALDAAFDELRKAAPYESDWNADARRGDQQA